MQEVKAFRTSDGELFDKEGDATQHELELALTEALENGAINKANISSVKDQVTMLLAGAENLSRLFLHYCNTNTGKFTRNSDAR